MKRVLSEIKIKELTPNGFVEVFTLETEPIPEEDTERLGEAFTTLTKTAMEGNSMYLTTELGSVIIRGLDKKTIRLVSVFKEVEEDADN